MSKRLLDTDDVRRLLRQEVERVGSQSEWARRTGVGRTYLNHVMSGRRNPGPDFNRALKLTKVVVYAMQEG